MDQIKRLWQLLPHPANTTVRWFAKTLDGQTKWGGYADSAGDLIEAAENGPDMNFYVCPNPASSRTGVRHRTEDVTHWSWFLIDVDPVVKEGYRPETLMYDALLRLGEWLAIDFNRVESRPVVIDSGRGMQAWVRLDDLLLSDVEVVLDLPKAFGVYDLQPVRRRVTRLTMRHWLERLNTVLGERDGCRIDTTCSDLPRPMRCPGTMNRKTKRMAEFRCDSARVFKGLAERLIQGVPPQHFIVDPVPSLPAGTEWQDVLVHLTIKAQNYLTRGKVEPGRHETMWHTARCLAERGLLRDAVRRALQYANARQGPDNELSPEDVEHAIDTAFIRLTPEAESARLNDSPNQEGQC